MAEAYAQFRMLKPVAATRNVLLPVGGDHTIPSRWATQMQRRQAPRYVWPRLRVRRAGFVTCRPPGSSSHRTPTGTASPSARIQDQAIVFDVAPTDTVTLPQGPPAISGPLCGSPCP